MNIILRYADSKTSEACPPFHDHSFSPYLLWAQLNDINGKVFILSKLLFMETNWKKKYTYIYIYVYTHTYITESVYLYIWN